MAVALTTSVQAAQVPVLSASESSLPWPAQVVAVDVGFVVYAPQLDNWSADRLEGRAAVEVRLPGTEETSFGVIWFGARTVVDTAGQVTIGAVTVNKADFPLQPNRSSEFLDALRQGLAAKAWTIPRQRLEADLAIERAAQQTQTQPLKNDPPSIIYSDRPAILVSIDGAPVMREVPTIPALLRVVNTRALVVLDKTTGRYDLQAAGHWFTAGSLDGPWSLDGDPAAVLERAKEQALAQDQVELLDDGEARDGNLPAIHVSTRPAELIRTDGPPQFSPIDRTQLLYVTNSPNSIFLELKSGYYYVLLSGRWYGAKTLTQGPWQYVSGTSLPADFAMIPSTHPAQSVREAVPGTPEAQEAAIASSVPQMATVKRTAAKLELSYDGEPLFEPIEATTLQRAVNAPLPVIRVEWNQFYALDNGVWFFADSPHGPWAVATYVPPVVYSIPRSSPLHYVTYVRVYDSTPDVVYVGYTPGYIGSYLSSDNVIVYGTGWYYSPWVGSVWYGAPVTWGFGFTIFNSWWNPWWRPAWGFVYAPVPCMHPWWGPWYRPVARVVVAGAVPPRGPVITPIHANRVVAGSFNAANFNRSAVNVTHLYGRWGSNVVLATSRPRIAPTAVSAVPVNAGASSRALAAIPRGMARPVQPAQAPARAAQAATQSGADVISSSDGRVYRRTGGQWQRFTGNGNWQNIGSLNTGSMNTGASNSAQPESSARIGAANPAGVSGTAGRVARANTGFGPGAVTGSSAGAVTGSSAGAVRASPMGVQPSPGAVQSPPAPARARPFPRSTAMPSSFPPQQQREAPPIRAPAHAPMSSASPIAPGFEPSAMPLAAGFAAAGAGAAGMGRDSSSFAHGRDSFSRGRSSAGQARREASR
jgi:hypothetical protein